MSLHGVSIAIGPCILQHSLLSVVSAIHHEGVCEALYDRALSFAEAFDGIAVVQLDESKHTERQTRCLPARRMRNVDRSADLNVIGQRDISNLDLYWLVFARFNCSVCQRALTSS